MSLGVERPGFVPYCFSKHLPEKEAIGFQPLANSKVEVTRKNLCDSHIQIVLGYGESVLEFLKDKLNRNSFDDKGSKLRVHLHVQGVDNNAQWFENAVYIGNVVGNKARYYYFLEEDIEVIAHEIGHGVVQHTAKFVYEGQSGALNESWCDVLASLVKQCYEKQTAEEADWLIGKDYVRGLPEEVQALRSLKEPGKAYKFSERQRSSSEPYE